MRNYAKRPDLAMRHKARRAVRAQIEAGRMTRQPCEVCGAAKVQAHHFDYTKPLDVSWLCRPHHRVMDDYAKAEGR